MLIWRGVSVVLETSEFKNRVVAYIGYVFLRRRSRWPESPPVSASAGAAFPVSWDPFDCESCPGWPRDVSGGLGSTQAGQEGRST